MLYVVVVYSWGHWVPPAHHHLIGDGHIRVITEDPQRALEEARAAKQDHGLGRPIPARIKIWQIEAEKAYNLSDFKDGHRDRHCVYAVHRRYGPNSEWQVERFQGDFEKFVADVA